MRIVGAAILGGLAAFGLVGGAAAQDEAGFQAYLRTLRADALRAGVSARTADAVLPTLTMNPRVIELDRGQPGDTRPNAPVPRFAPYRERHVDAARIGRGRRAFAANLGRLRAIEADSGVPAKILVAIWGHETNYGGYKGDFDLARSLATLAYEGRRRPLFAGEFIALLKIIDQGTPREQLKGSWAGAMGHPQFLPSVYLRLAKDGDGDGRADIWNNETDALASIANYLRNAGWRRGQPWGFAVSVPGSLARGSLDTRTVSPRCPRVFERHSQWRTMREWRALGVTPQGGAWPADDVQAVLLEPDGPGQTAYLLTSNYRVILDYNCSNFYALSVGLLADEVAR
ncbi:lytic murein transglycosylase [Sphingomonas baiyangensis]|uniref:Lytic murein transglycosylase n=1 Tax=Sphingomonas baiyangensis TaxID=2572576 RepID=A0A4U1L737_9SPHN|nr:lytic murein transglycosylase [Sphingomonas baiyangensis]TKD52145.1 lytic murein transglycosylase [Sphingomonas baiyangensis]